jgi:fluoroquinolone transport system permease protein
MKQVLKLAITDFKLIFRDPSLRTFLFFPVILLVLIIWVLPSFVQKNDFLIPYLPVFLIIAAIENTQMFCFISSMVLIDEKESEVAKVYGIVPLSKFKYIVSRFIIPYFFTVSLNVILFIVQPFYSISFGNNLVISLLTALIVPLYVLSINAIVINRMQGMVYIKAFNMIVLVPIVAFFIPPQFKHLFGFLPTHWIFQSIDNVTNQLPILWLTTIGFVFTGTLIWFASKWFIRKHFL